MEMQLQGVCGVIDLKYLPSEEKNNRFVKCDKNKSIRRKR